MLHPRGKEIYYLLHMNLVSNDYVSLFHKNFFRDTGKNKPASLTHIVESLERHQGDTTYSSYGIHSHKCDSKTQTFDNIK